MNLHPEQHFSASVLGIWSWIILCQGGGLWTIGCSAASLASTHQIPVHASTQAVIAKIPLDITNPPGEGQNCSQLRTTALKYVCMYKSQPRFSGLGDFGKCLKVFHDRNNFSKFMGEVDSSSICI